jgi:hypothetical protein
MKKIFAAVVTMGINLHQEKASQFDKIQQTRLQ